MSRSPKNPAPEAPDAIGDAPLGEAEDLRLPDEPGKKAPGMDAAATPPDGPSEDAELAQGFGPPSEDRRAPLPADVGEESSTEDGDYAHEGPETGPAANSVEVELAQTKDRWLRAMAELDNYRKRSRRELESALNLANAKVLRELLEVVDNFERALAAEDLGAERPDDSFLAGIRLIYGQLMEVLRQNGVSRIEAEGASFDPNLHEAVLQVESEETPSHHIVQVVQQGYLLRETVLRPARVIVAT